MEYDRLLEYFQKEVAGLEEEKEEFRKVAAKLRFKEKVGKEQGLMYSKAKSHVEMQLLTQNLSAKGS